MKPLKVKYGNTTLMITGAEVIEIEQLPHRERLTGKKFRTVKLLVEEIEYCFHERTNNVGFGGRVCANCKERV